MPNAFDIQSITSPISDENQTGSDIRLDTAPNSPYQTIKGARNSARAAERQSIHDGNSNEADKHWRTVLTLAPEILSTQAKDLEIACWYAEAVLRLKGFAGLRDAFLVIQALIEHFWDDLHPMPDEDGLETRIACIAGLNGEGVEGVLIAPIRKTAFTEGNSQEAFNLWQYQQALDIQKNPDEKIRQDKQNKIGFSLEDVEKAVNESSDSFFIEIRSTLNETIELYKNTGSKLDEHCGLHDAPPIRTVIDVLEECLGAVNHLGKNKFPVDAPAIDADENEPDTQSPTSNQANNVTAAAINTRQEAFKQLQDIAEFFRKTEPHSPVSYVLEKAVKWGNMPLDKLIGELIPDSSSRSHYSELTGVLGNQE